MDILVKSPIFCQKKKQIFANTPIFGHKSKLCYNSNFFQKKNFAKNHNFRQVSKWVRNHFWLGTHFHNNNFGQKFNIFKFD